MSDTIACPVCSLNDVATAADHYECMTCGHEWPRAEAEPGPRVVKDANGNVIVSGDDVVLIKELKLKGSSGALKGGTKIRNIRIVEDGDHEIDCKVEGMAVMLKAVYVKKA